MPIINLHPATSYEPSGEHAPNARDLQGKVALRDRPHLPRLVSDRVVPNNLVDHRGGERRYRSTAPPARNSSVARRGCSKSPLHRWGHGAGGAVGPSGRTHGSASASISARPLSFVLPAVGHTHPAGGRWTF